MAHKAQFRGRLSFLSNMAASPIKLWGEKFPTAEHAYAWSKAFANNDKAAETEILATSNPVSAKKAARMLRHKNPKESIEAMVHILCEKFAQNSELLTKLRSIPDSELVERNTWGDKFWGVDWDTGRGLNHLGRILKHVKENL